MSKSTRIIKRRLSASIVTITQLIRSECLLNLYDLIKLQTYKNIVDWVIVEGSSNEEDGDKNKNNIANIINNHKLSFKIIYIEYSNQKLSDLRNSGNSKCSGDIIVCMDDDDYYPPERVEHAVESLDKSGCLIAGCSDIYLYEYFLGKLYKFKGFNQNHSTNNLMAFKREYLRNHKHESGLIMSEEKSFTNNFTESMVQLNARKSIIVSSHNFNTFNKRELCIGGTIGVNPTLYEVNENITNYIPSQIFNRMYNLFYKEEESKYDIVYYTGGLCKKWDPKDKSLGGSEQAIVNLCEYWASMGKKVAVYGEIIFNKVTEFTHNNVEYKNWRELPFNHKFKTLIMWRNYGFFSTVPFNVKAENLYWDLHDHFLGSENLINVYKTYGHKITKILFKSNFHKVEFNKFFSVNLKEEQYMIINNGLLIDKFKNNWDNVKRNPYRFCYVSYYTRGIQHIIPHIWSVIKQNEPRAELHLYYGMDMFDDENLKNHLKSLVAQSGVIDHGRQPIDMIVREKYMSGFQLYITNTIAEIDCISIRESLITGCIPLISNFGVFTEREGIHFNLNENDIQSMNQIGINICNLMKNMNKVNLLREVFKKSETIMSWEEVANKIIT
jgi:glycosyltransferase involved in cell wall biosynthesis